MILTRTAARSACIAPRAHFAGAAFALIAAFALVATFAMVAVPGQAHAITVRQTDVATASDGCILLGVDGKFSTAGKEAALARINKIRKEACDEGVPDPRNSDRALTSADYAPIKWSSSLEEIAQTRAAEGAVSESHTRPNGKSCFTAYRDREVRSYAEVLAWNWSGMLGGINQWYGEKSDWVKQRAGAVTGHYTSMIDPDNTHVGLGTFNPSQGGWICTAGEFYCASADEAVAEEEVGVKGAYRQAVEIPQANIQSIGMSGKSKIEGRGTAQYTLEVNVAVESLYGASVAALVPLDDPIWSSNNTSVVVVDASGKASAVGCGRAVVSAEALGKKTSATVEVTPAKTAIKKIAPKKKALKITWNKGAAFAQGYQVKYSTKANMKGAKTVSVKGANKASRVIKKLKAKASYYVTVRSYAKVAGKAFYSDWSKVKSAKTK